MAKKKKLQATAPVLTRGQLSRAERERRQIRNLYTSIIGVVSFLAALLLFAVVSTFVIKPNEAIASVNGVNITRGTYQKLRRWNVFQTNLQQQLSGSQSGLSATAAQTPLNTVDNETTLDDTTVKQLIDSEVLRQSAKSDPKVAIAPTDDELRTEARNRNLPTPTPPTTPAPSVTATSEVAATANFTPTATMTFTPGPATRTPTVTATLPPVPGAQQTAEAIYSREIQSYSKGTGVDASDSFCSAGCPNISESDFLHLIIEPGYLQTKVTDKLATGVITQPEQIHAQHILTDTEEGAKKIIQMLDQHGADPDSKYFTQLANTESKEQLDNQKNGQPLTGGDLGWFPKDNSGFVQEFVTGAWPVQAGKYTETPVKTSFGYHVIKVLERDPHRALSQDKIDTAKNQAYQTWFEAQQSTAKISPAKYISTPTPLPTQPVVTEPTQAPLVLTPAPGTPLSSPPAGNTPVATLPSAGTPTAPPK